MADEMFYKKVIAEVAKATKLSEHTIELIIKGDNAVIPEVRDRVLELLAEKSLKPEEFNLGKPDLKSNIIAVCAAYFSSAFMSEVMHGIERKVRDTGYKLFQFSTKGNPYYENELIEYIIDEIKPAGFITLSTSPEKTLIDRFESNNVPVVIIDEIVEGYTTITYDNMKAGYIAVEHLINKGRKNPAIISGRRHIKGGYNALQRYNGFITALEDSNLQFDQKNIIEVWRYDFADGVDAFEKLFKGSSQPDSVFCAAGDVCAMGFLKAAHDAGAKIPDDIAIVGFDDIDASAFSTPSLTTIKQPLAQMGARAFELISQPDLYKEKKGTHISFDAKIVIRKSS